jgi:hypothetical protein
VFQEDGSMGFSEAFHATAFAVVALSAGVGSLDAQSSRLDFGAPPATTSQIPLSFGSIGHSTSIWRGVMWGAAVGAVAAGAVCASSESCRKDGGVFEDAVFGAALGAAVGGAIGVFARDKSNVMNHRRFVIGPVVLRVRFTGPALTG